MNRLEFIRDLGLDLVEYLAVLISPSPKDTIKAVEKRRAMAERERAKRGEIDGISEDHKLFKKDHRNTTFYDEIAKYAGDDISKQLQEEMGDGDKEIPTVEEYELDHEDLDFIEQARKKQQELLYEDEKKKRMDSIEF